MLFRLLAVLYNALPVRWQRRILDRTQSRFLVGVVGLGVDPNGHVILARHRFGAPEWRFLGGFLSPRERLEDALAREVREETGIEIESGAFGTDALGRETRVRPGCALEETEKPSTGGPAARAEPASNARPIAATRRRRISLRLGRDGASGALARAPARGPVLRRLSPAFP